MKPRLVILAAVALVMLVAYQFVPAAPTDADLNAIKRVINRRTSEPVLRINSLPNGAVDVWTGWVKGPLYGDGEIFRLRKTFGVWWIYRRGHWSV
jgi:hypothetical protein